MPGTFGYGGGVGFGGTAPGIGGFWPWFGS
jgi:hypothetical protein